MDQTSPTTTKRHRRTRPVVAVTVDPALRARARIVCEATGIPFARLVEGALVDRLARLEAALSKLTP